MTSCLPGSHCCSIPTMEAQKRLAEAICNGNVLSRAVRYGGDAAQPILAKSRILFRICFTARKLNDGNLKVVEQKHHGGHKYHKYHKSIGMPWTIISFFRPPHAHRLHVQICSNCGARIASQLPVWLVYSVPSRKVITPAENHSVFEWVFRASGESCLKCWMMKFKEGRNLSIVFFGLSNFLGFLAGSWNLLLCMPFAAFWRWTLSFCMLCTTFLS